jgi:hypothetical protein
VCGALLCERPVAIRPRSASAPVIGELHALAPLDAGERR